MKKIVLLVLMLSVLFVLSSNKTYANEEIEETYFYVYEEDYGYAIVQVLSQHDNNYLIETEEEDFLYLTTNQKLYVGGWYIVVIKDEGVGVYDERIVDIMRIEKFDEERLFEALIGYYENEVGQTLNENEFMYWLATNYPQLYHDYMVGYFNYVDEYWWE